MLSAPPVEVWQYRKREAGSLVHKVYRFKPLLACFLRRGLPLVAFCCAFAFVAHQETREPNRTYRLPRGDASTTLSPFAAASEPPVVFIGPKFQGVKPAPPMPAPEPVITAAPRADIKLTGITSLQGRKTAFFMTAAAGERARYHTLSEGQKDDRLEVLSIDLAGDTVEALVEQVYHRLSFATHGFRDVLSSAGPKTPLEEIRFDEEHIRRHEEIERRDLIRTTQERAEAEVELGRRAEAKKKSGAEPRGEDTHAASP